MLYLFDLDIIN